MLYGPRVDRALALVSEDFRGITRKGTSIPYLSHLLQVAVTVMEHGGDEDQIVAALLHDWLEDIEHASEERLRAEFGPRVCTMVVALSDSQGLPKPPWRERKERYLAHLKEQPAEVVLICAADKLHNARSIVRDVEADGIEVWDRFKAGRAGSAWYYQQITEILRGRCDPRLFDLLDVEVKRLRELAGE